MNIFPILVHAYLARGFFYPFEFIAKLTEKTKFNEYGGHRAIYLKNRAIYMNDSFKIDNKSEKPIDKTKKVLYM